MIPSDPATILVLRRVPRRRPILIEDLVRLVSADLAAASDQLYMYLTGSLTVTTLIEDLVGKGFLRFGYDRTKGRGPRAAVMPKPDFVSTTDETRRSLQDQVGIKELWDGLPRSPIGLLDALANEVDE